MHEFIVFVLAFVFIILYPLSIGYFLDEIEYRYGLSQILFLSWFIPFMMIVPSLVVWNIKARIDNTVESAVEYPIQKVVVNDTISVQCSIVDGDVFNVTKQFHYIVPENSKLLVETYKSKNYGMYFMTPASVRYSIREAKNE